MSGKKWVSTQAHFGPSRQLAGIFMLLIKILKTLDPKLLGQLLWHVFWLGIRNESWKPGNRIRIRNRESKSMFWARACM